MRTLGDAKKLFHELEHGDKLYYIDPKKPHEVSELTVKEVRKATDARYVVIVYYKSEDATTAVKKMVDDNIKAMKEMPIEVKEIQEETRQFNKDLLDNIPVGKLIVPKNSSGVMSHTLPPSVYYTNKKALLKFMGK